MQIVDTTTMDDASPSLDVHFTPHSTTWSPRMYNHTIAILCALPE